MCAQLPLSGFSRVKEHQGSFIKWVSDVLKIMTLLKQQRKVAENSTGIMGMPC